MSHYCWKREKKRKLSGQKDIAVWKIEHYSAIAFGTQVKPIIKKVQCSRGWGKLTFFACVKLNALASFRVHWFHQRGRVRRVELPNNTLLFGQDAFSPISGISLKLRMKFSWPRESVLRSVSSKLWVRRPLETRLFLDRLIGLFTAGVEPTGQRWCNMSAPGWSPGMRSPIM